MSYMCNIFWPFIHCSLLFLTPLLLLHFLHLDTMALACLLCICDGHSMCRRQLFTAFLPSSLWLLQSVFLFLLLSATFTGLWSWWWRCPMYSDHSLGTYFQNLSKFWLSALIVTHYEKDFLPPRLRAALIYVYEHKYLEGSLKTGPFCKAPVVQFLVGPVISSHRLLNMFILPGCPWKGLKSNQKVVGYPLNIHTYFASVETSSVRLVL